jgi:hypothetical protein
MTALLVYPSSSGPSNVICGFHFYQQIRRLIFRSGHIRTLKRAPDSGNEIYPPVF